MIGSLSDERIDEIEARVRSENSEWLYFEREFARAIKAEVLATATAVQPEVERLVRQIHQAVKRGEGTQDHGVVGNLRCILDHVLPDVPDFAAVQPEPVAWQLIETAPQNKTIILANFGAADLLSGAPHVWTAYFASEDGWINGAGEKVKGPAMWCEQSYAATKENGLPTHWMPLPAAPSGDTSKKP